MGGQTPGRTVAAKPSLRDGPQGTCCSRAVPRQPRPRTRVTLGRVTGWPVKKAGRSAGPGPACSWPVRSGSACPTGAVDDGRLTLGASVVADGSSQAHPRPIRPPDRSLPAYSQSAATAPGDMPCHCVWDRHPGLRNRATQATWSGTSIDLRPASPIAFKARRGPSAVDGTHTLLGVLDEAHGESRSSTGRPSTRASGRSRLPTTVHLGQRRSSRSPRRRQ